MNITIKGKAVNSFIELKNALHPDGQGSGTLEGVVTIDSKDFFVRKHWSYSGGFPVYDGNIQVGEIVLDGGTSYCEGKHQTLYDAQGREKGDAVIEYIER